MLVLRHRRHAVRERQEQDRYRRRDQKCRSPNHFLTLGRLDARVKELDSRCAGGTAFCRLTHMLSSVSSVSASRPIRPRVWFSEPTLLLAGSIREQEEFPSTCFQYFLSRERPR